MFLVTVVLGVIALVVLCSLLKIVFVKTSRVYHVQKLSGPPGCNWIFGNIKPLHTTPGQIFQVLRNWGRSYYPIYKLWVISISVANLICPEDMKLILSDMNHIKKSLAYNLLHKWLGTGLLTSTGSKWQLRRKILTPAFHFNILQDFILTFNEKADELVEVLKRDCDKPYTEISPLMTHFSLKIIGETSMGRKLEFNSEKEKNYKSAFHDFVDVLIYRVLHPYLVHNWLYIFTPHFYREVKSVKTLHSFTTEVIAEREKDFHSGSTTVKTRKRLAMLDLLLTAKREGLIDNEGIREEVDTFMFEGHDTVSAAMMFGLMMIANHPKVQEEIVNEMKDVLGDIKKKPQYSDLQELSYMERCLKEVLRLYPSVHYISRELGKDLVTHTGYKLKKGTVVQLHIYDLHRNPDIYPDPEKFDPDRFLPHNCDQRHPFAYIPFSAGPRNCIGQRFAMLEMKAILCGILGNFVLEAVDTPESVVLTLDVILRTKDNIKVKFLPRI